MICTVNNFKDLGLLETLSGLQRLDLFASNSFLLAFYNVQYIVQRNGNKPNLQRVKNIHFHQLLIPVFELFPYRIVYSCFTYYNTVLFKNLLCKNRILVLRWFYLVVVFVLILSFRCFNFNFPLLNTLEVWSYSYYKNE